MIEVRLQRVDPGVDRYRGSKGVAAEAAGDCLGRCGWAVGEYPPDCHASGALS